MSDYSDDGSLGSDFAELAQEYEVDDDGNPLDADGNLLDSSTAKKKRPDDSSSMNTEMGLEERRRKKRLEKLDKKIKSIQKKQSKEKSIKKDTPADIRNKQKRQEVALLKKMEERRVSKIERLKKKKLREEHGEDACPKGEVKTIESMRVKDETICRDADDEELLGEQSIDEFASYFKGQTTPKILMTTNRRPKGRVFDFLKEIKSTFPNCEYYERKNFQMKKVIEEAKERGYTDLMLWYEKNGFPHSLILSHLPEGPTATFRVSGLKLRQSIINHGAAPGMTQPELIMNNFDTMLGNRIGRMLASLFPQVPNLQARRVITLHNQRDFVFFRHHRYQFNEDGSRASLQEVGPRFTLKLHTLQLGTMNKKHGEMEFVYKPRDGVNRKKFIL